LNLDIRKLQRAIVDGLEDVKAQDIVVLNTEHLSSMFERVIIASGGSNRQTKALASSVRETVKKRGLPVLGTEGEDNGEWIIVDCGAAVAHIMQPAIREYYHLEEIWGGKPVRMKSGPAVRTGLVKAGEPEPAARKTTRRANAAEPPAPPAKKAAPRKPVPVPAAKAPPRKATGAAPSPARKAAGTGPAPARKAAGAPSKANAGAPRKAAPAAPRKAPSARKTPR
jgi:ribosome-associated protein